MKNQNIQNIKSLLDWACDGDNEVYVQGQRDSYTWGCNLTYVTLDNAEKIYFARERCRFFSQ